VSSALHTLRLTADGTLSPVTLTQPRPHAPARAPRAVAPTRSAGATGYLCVIASLVALYLACVMLLWLT
jgi:hypothetical protein